MYNSLPFGDGYAASGEDIDAYHFAGQDQDTSANDHAQYREYSNLAGRWFSPDPYTGSYDPLNPQSMNRYAYVLSNPLGFTDPSGMPSNAAYTVHPFQYAIQGSESESVSSWDTRFGNFEQGGNAMIVTAWDEDFSCASDPNQTITDDFLQTYLPGHSIGMIAYDWDGPYWSSGYLVNSYNYSGNTANYSVVDPNNSGCAQDGGNELLQEFKVQAGQ